jgi:hypothetical protein
MVPVNAALPQLHALIRQRLSKSEPNASAAASAAPSTATAPASQPMRVYTLKGAEIDDPSLLLDDDVLRVVIDK